MRYLLIVFAWVFLVLQGYPVAAAAHQPGSKITVFILAGQSNAVGYNHLGEYHGDTAWLPSNWIQRWSTSLFITDNTI